MERAKGHYRKTHEVTIRVTFDKPMTAKAARYAVWNAIQDHELWGMDNKEEPFGYGKIKVRRSR